MRKIGLTGGIASGKSTVAGLLSGLGVPVFDADKEAHLLLQQDKEVFAKLKAKFMDELGLDILDAKGGLDRKKLGEFVFAKPELLGFLEKLLHGKIARKMADFSRQAEQAGHKAVVFDIPLLFEKGWQEKVDLVWLVYVPEEMQRERLSERDKLNRAEIKQRVAAQLPLKDKVALADVLIDNSGSLSETKIQVEKAWLAQAGGADEAT